MDALYAWSWILLFLGFGMRHLRRPHRWLPMANTAVLSFYVLHQPVLPLVGYFVVGWDVPILLNWLIITLTAFVAVVGVYEAAVRRWNPMRTCWV